MSDWIEFDGNAEGFPEGETDGQKLVRLHDLANQLVEANRRDGKPRKIVLKIGHDERQRFRTVGATEDCQQFVCEVAICVEDGAKVSTDQLRDYLEDALCIDIDTEENGTGPEAAGEKATVSVSIVLSTLDTDDPLYNRIPVPSLLKLAPVDLESAVDDLDNLKSYHDPACNNAIGGMEMLVLAHARAGVNVEHGRYADGVRDAVQGVTELEDEAT